MPERQLDAGRGYGSGQSHFGGLISLSGEPFSGKKTVASILAKNGYWYIDGFLKDAWRVTREILFAIGYSGPVLESMISGCLRDVQNPTIKQTPRNVSVAISRLFFQNPDFSDIWTKRLTGRVNSIRRTGDNVVLDDVLYVQNGRKVTQAGGMRLWIERPARRGISQGGGSEDRAIMMEKMYALKPGPRWYPGNQKSVLIETLMLVLMDYPSILPSDKETKKAVEKAVEDILLPFLRGQPFPHFSEPLKMARKNTDITLFNGGSISDLARSVEDILASTDLHMIAAAIQDEE